MKSPPQPFVRPQILQHVRKKAFFVTEGARPKRKLSDPPTPTPSPTGLWKLGEPGFGRE